MVRLLALVITAVVSFGALGGCGGGGGSTAGSAGTAATGSGASGQSPAPLSKDDYESRGLAALQPALSTPSGTLTPDQWGTVGTAYQQAHDAFAALAPPPDVAALHRQVVANLAASAQAATRIHDALQRGDQAGAEAARTAFRTQSQDLIGLGKQFSARGYTKLGS